ncbi:Sec-independent protein translocase subunit TatA/TatB [Rubrobacter indicoceani]|uniref:Sec-independent protein translocase subunit TatA/TatB n=1 Tax=Rubrobacter indicoceani TaxID=2051957 RepID=UPI0013C4EC76|nr:twin-arginine translocase TatA/TatE family subunit [Rubrobacter indicoceani]
MIGPLEIFALLFVVFVILGPKRIVSLAKSLGKGATDFVGSLGSPPDDDDKPDKARRKLPPPRD